MSEYVEFVLDDGTRVAVSPTATRAGSGTVGLGGKLEAAEKTLRQALAPVTAAAAEMLDDFRRLAHPDEVEIAFGVALRWRAAPAAAPASVAAPPLPPAPEPPSS
jgi:hypothetical protein